MILKDYINTKEVKDYRKAIRDVHSAASDSSRISGHTHNFYKYPACFHPIFSKTVMKNFSFEGDVVLDPFVGGGTSAVESMLLQREFVGVDINPIAIFSTTFKTLKLNKRELNELDEFFTDILTIKVSRVQTCKVREEYCKGVNPLFINLIGHIKLIINNLAYERSRIFAKGILLRQSKIVFDNPKKTPSRVEFLSKLFWDYEALVDQHIQFIEECKENQSESGQKLSKIKLIKGSIAENSTISKIKKSKKEIDLVVTSPPYPGKHILYNKWQVNGRLENYLPHWIIDSDEIKSESFYTMGGRSKSGVKKYFETIDESFSNIRKVISPNGLVVQMVAFFDRSKQLQPFLESMSSAGYREVRNLTNNFDQRIWRDVPNRKWFNSANKRKACQEVVLFHVPK